MHIDTCEGGYGHDIRLPCVKDAIMKLAKLSNCLGVLISVPCDTWSAIRFNDEVDGPKPLRDTDHVLGIPLADGSLPSGAIVANEITVAACDIGRACAGHGGHIVAESPVSRATAWISIRYSWT